VTQEQEVYHVRILEHSQVHLQKTGHSEFHNPSSDNILTFIMGFTWQKRWITVYTAYGKYKRRQHQPLFCDINMTTLTEMDRTEVQYKVKYNADTPT
jgi:hypothetical protein